MTNKSNVVAEQTDIEVAITKFEARLASLKHIDGKAVALDYVFPLLRKLAQSAGDQDVQIESLVNAVENIEVGGDSEVIEALEQAREIIAKLSELLDTAMVAAEFYIVTPTGLQDTGKAPADLRQAYVNVGPEVRDCVLNIQDAIQGYEEEADEDEDEDDEDEDAQDFGPDGDSDQSDSTDLEAVAGAAASRAIAEAVSAVSDASGAAEGSASGPIPSNNGAPNAA